MVPGPTTDVEASPPAPLRRPPDPIDDRVARCGRGGDGREMTARELALAIGLVELDVLRTHHRQLAAAVADLARVAGRNWAVAADDPTVAVLRALADLAIEAPDATSGHAAPLVRAIRSPS